jgi:mannose-6-phosphate isomerase-like protein (cupin superfamily)
MSRPVRRVVTGHRPDGRSTIVVDAPAPNVKQRNAGNASTLLWVTEESPANLSGNGDRDIAVPPPRRGSIFRIAEFPPYTGGEVRDNETVLRDFGIGPEVRRGHPPRHPAIHRTRSLDYVIVLEGEIDLLVDDGEVRLRTGDVVIQRATNHAWINRGDAVCRLGMVFIDAEEPPELQ